MKSALLLISSSVILFLLSCNSGAEKSNESDSTDEIADTVYDNSISAADDSILYVKNKSLLWNIDEDSGYKLQKPKVTGIDTMTVQHIISLLNNNYDSIHLDYIKTSHDTVYVHIPNSEMLTERIGSTGAQMYMASTTYSLTELKGIKYVNYDFEEGDHASPGVYNRETFKNFR